MKGTLKCKGQKSTTQEPSDYQPEYVNINKDNQGNNDGIRACVNTLRPVVLTDVLDRQTDR